ncbi:family 78 glycoside hydrolase catalytic domain [Pseudactinotalea sp.]|uniref:family 78 glycoside hydrolase catalytic domain n=1 Tax=Pseudactinotalea sp. TaxID=1926260 RepID=UPI003B3B2F8E
MPAVPATIDTLAAELRTDSPFVATPTPRLTWTVADPDGGWLQAWAEIRSGETSARVEGRDSVLVDWPFPPLTPGASVAVQVRAGASDGRETDWSEPLEIRAGFLAAGDWSAAPVTLADPHERARPALLRTTFDSDDITSATLYWTALGVAEIRINGTLIDEDVLSPGWSAYQQRLVHETVDVTDLVRAGTNAIAAELGGGWYTERWGFRENAAEIYGGQPALALQLNLVHADGRTTVITTDEQWRAHASPTQASSLYQGESYDGREAAALAGWDQPDFDDSAWTAVERSDGAFREPEARVGPPVRRTEDVAAVEVITTPSGATVLDFGQNLVGRLRLTARGEAGATITLKHAEVLEHGELGTRPLRSAAATDTWTLAGTGEETWEPRFTFHGFRYAQIDGWPGEIDPTDVVAVVLHNDMDRTGTFTTSHTLLQQLHDNVVWGMRGNFLAVPTDCPQRDERLGWTGDIEVFGPTAASLYDVRGFLTGWLRDLALEQSAADGVVPFVVPNVLQLSGRVTPAAAWSDAATIVPWTLYQRYGDLGVLREAYPSMRSWVETLLEISDGTGLWEGAFQFGDWLDPAAPPDRPADATTSVDVVAGAYLALSARILADAAEVLGEPADTTRFRAAAEQAREAWCAEYVTPAGRMMSDGQTAYAMAIAFDLVTDTDQRQRLGDRLADLVREDGYRIGTGFVGTPIVCDALTATGHLEAATRLLTQTENPSWLYPVTMGATTIWERWDSMLPDGTINPGQMTSFNHYALGAVADWMHRVMAGLAPAEPGYRTLRIGTRPLVGIESAATTLDTPYGHARVGWELDGDTVTVRAEVPPNTTAQVDLPGVPATEVGSGAHTWVIAAPEAPTARRPLTVDSPSAAIIDDPEAYALVAETIGRVTPSNLEAFHRTRWSERATLRESVRYASNALVEELNRALATLR